jgi:hypothetical protein
MRSSVGPLFVFLFLSPFFSSTKPTMDFDPFYSTSPLNRHPAQWPSSCRQPSLLGSTGSFVLTTPAEAKPSARAAACRAPLPPNIASTSTLPACTCACHGLHDPARTPPPPYLFKGDFERKENEKKTRIKFMSNPQRTLQEYSIWFKGLFGTLFCSC